MDPHRTTNLMYHLRRDRSQQQSAERSAVVGTEDDQIYFVMVGPIRDLVCGFAFHRRTLDARLWQIDRECADLVPCSIRKSFVSIPIVIGLSCRTAGAWDVSHM